MSNNEFMYAVERSDEYLAHYGIRGMKWGVRRAIKSGNSARLGRQYAKAQKKLAKLEKQAGKSKKYARRAALMGAGAAAAGGLAALGTSGVNRVLNKGGAALSKGGAVVGKGLNKAGYAVGKFGNSIGAGAVTSKINRGLNLAGAAVTKGSKAANAGLYKAGFAVGKWGNSNSIANALAGGTRNTALKAGTISRNLGGSRVVADANMKAIQGANKLRGVSNNTIARIGAGAIGAGLAVGAARNAYKAATAQKKAAKFRSAMNESFKGTKYANGGQPRQGKKRRNRG